MVDDKKSCSPENLQGVASELRKLADQIQAGQITVSGVTLSICNAVSLKMKQKLVGGHVKVDVSLTASLVDTTPFPLDNSHVSQKEPKKNKSLKSKKKSRPYEAKKLKKNIAQQWKQISNAIAASKVPDSFLIKGFLEICDQYGKGAEDEWHPQWQESVETIKQAVKLAQKAQFQEASALLTAINNQKRTCHKRFK